jgi:hypothetical protein
MQVVEEVAPPRPTGSASARWMRRAAILLSLPALIPLANSLIVPYLKNRIPTGFIQYDMPYYLANARGHFNQGFHFLYSNPYAGYDAPGIYFQPQIMLLGLMQQLGLHPGVTFNLFGLLALFFAAIVAAQFYVEVVGAGTLAKRIGFICFFWGGGVLTLAGLAYGLATGHPLSSPWRYDPTSGWWMLNFGRNLVYPMEAYYHAVFLLSLLFLIRRQLSPALAFAALLSCSHPFTGLTLILILIAYSGIELVMRSGAVTLKFMLGAILLAGLHVTYYLVWLNRFAEHRVLQSQWQVAWLYPPLTYIPALLIVGCFAIWRLAGSFHCFRDSRIRLFAVWFLVVFALTQHNLVVRPIQPIHFAHGYDWMALFFLGAAPLIATLDFFLKSPRPWLRWGALPLLLGLFLFDNAAWLAKNVVYNGMAVTLSKSESAALGWLSRNLKAGDMVICQDENLSYLVATYTPARSWEGHFRNTPFFAQRHNEIVSVFSEGSILPEWKRPGVFYVSPAAWQPPAELRLERRYADTEFSIWTSIKGQSF